MDNEIKVSIIITAYNVEKFIKKCIESVIAQTFKQLEIIVVDDGSTDSTLKTIKEITENHSNIIVLNKNNDGVSEARNLGIKHAKGVYITFVDGDDWIEADMIENMYIKAEELGADVTVCDAIVDYEDGRRFYLKSGDIKEYGEKLINNKNIIVNMLPAVWNKLYKKTLFTEKNIYFPKGAIGEDLATTFRILVSCDKICKVNRGYYHYIQREGSLMRQYNDQIFDIYQMFDVMKKFLYETNNYKIYKNEYEYLFLGNGIFSILMKIQKYKGDHVVALTKINKVLKSEIKNISDNIYYKYLTRNQKIYLFFIKHNIFFAYIMLKISLKLRGDKNAL